LRVSSLIAHSRILPVSAGLDATPVTPTVAEESVLNQKTS
jgi:hypothetical protein